MTAALSHGLQFSVVVFFVKNNPGECLVDPLGPLVETLVHLRAILEEIIPIYDHDFFGARVAENES